MSIYRKISSFIIAFFVIVTLYQNVARADSITDKLTSGKPVRIGFSHEIPLAYPGNNNEPLGFVNAHVTALLKKMGYNFEPVVMEWGGLIPALNAGRIDLITGGMYIISSRCKSVNFSEPLAVVSDAFIVQKGNPKGLQNYSDVRDKNAIFVTGAGYALITAARTEGIKEEKIMTVPGPSEILATVKSGRADAGGLAYFTAKYLAEKTDDVEVTDPKKMPVIAKNWLAVAMRKTDVDFLKAFNLTQKTFIGSEEMLKVTGKYGFHKGNLPGALTAESVCRLR